MILWRIAGLESVAADPRASEAAPILREHAEAALEVCAPTLAEWEGLDKIERAAFVAAAKRIKIRSACLSLRIAQGDAAAILAEYDPEAAEREELARVVRDAAAEPFMETPA